MSTPDRPAWRRVRELLPYFAGTRLAFAAAAVGAAVGGGTEAAVAKLIRTLTDHGFRSDGFALWLVPVTLIGLLLLRGAAGFVVNYALAWTANQGTLRMRTAMFDRLLGSQPGFMAQQTSSSLINTVVYELQLGATLLVEVVQTLLKDSFTVLALMSWLLWVNWQLTFLILLLFPAVAYVMRIFGKRMQQITRESQHATDTLAYVVEENVLAWRLTRLHGAQRLQARRFHAASQALRRLLLKATVATSTVTPVTQVMAGCALSAVIVVALWQSRSDGSTVGSFVSYVIALIGLIAPMKRLADVSGPTARGLASVERGLAMAKHAPQESGGTHAVERARGDLRLRGVGLRYRDDQAPALDGVDLDIRAGETVALVGPSGGGKSTLVNLLPRFLDPTQGSVSLDGVPLPDWELASLRRQFALVSQEVVLFNDSVAANVAFGETVDRERVSAALQAANLLVFVEQLPQGLDTAIGHNGSQLSGGQRQRMAIARAIYKNAPILLLDEATSALDSESERAVQTALERLMAGRTSIVIAHRLSTVEAADRIVVLDHGRVAEHGTRAELLARGGLFSRLHALQFNA